MAEYPARGGPLPIELVNTVFAEHGEPRDALATPDGLRDWLDVNRLQTPPSNVDIEQLRALRDALRELLTATVTHRPPDAAAIEQLNAVTRAAPRFEQLTLDNGELRARTTEIAQPADRALAAIARATVALVTGPDAKRVAVCGAPGCILFFLKDRRSAAWCSTACGNRARVARHYQRHHHRQS
jgi:predicted RNA-binding Zn ribbon-like protein